MDPIGHMLCQIWPKQLPQKKHSDLCYTESVLLVQNTCNEEFLNIIMQANYIHTSLGTPAECILRTHFASYVYWVGPETIF